MFCKGKTERASSEENEEGIGQTKGERDRQTERQVDKKRQTDRTRERQIEWEREREREREREEDVRGSAKSDVCFVSLPGWPRVLSNLAGLSSC